MSEPLTGVKSLFAEIDRLSLELDRLDKARQRNEEQLVSIANFIGKDARHAPESDSSIAGLVIAELTARDETIRRLRAAAKPFADLLPACGESHDQWPLYDAWGDTLTGAGDILNCGHVRKLAALLATDSNPAKEG